MKSRPPTRTGQVRAVVFLKYISGIGLGARVSILSLLHKILRTINAGALF